MEYKKYEYPSYNIYTVKTNRFKTIQMEIIFRDEVNNDELLAKTFLADIMTDCGYTYKTHKDLVGKLEELYGATLYGVTNKTGNTVMTSFVLNFLNPKYVSDSNYLEEVLKLPIDLIMNPLIDSKEFDIKNFKIVKNRLYNEILSVSEDISREAVKRTLKHLEGSPTSLSVIGSIDEIDKITPKTLYESYLKLMSNKCDIFIVGNIDMDDIANIIYKYFKYKVINTKELELYVDNKAPKKVKAYEEKAKFLETELVDLYSIENLNAKEKITTMYFYNYLLGGGGLNTKLYQLLREKNSLCYGIKSMYLKYDNLLLIETSIKKSDLKKAKKLIKVAFKEMELGKFSEEEINAAKENFIFSLNLALDSPAGILNNYIFNVYDNLPLIEDRINLIKEITKDEIVSVAKKIKPNISFVLEGVSNGEN